MLSSIIFQFFLNSQVIRTFRNFDLEPEIMWTDHELLHETETRKFSILKVSKQMKSIKIQNCFSNIKKGQE